MHTVRSREDAAGNLGAVQRAVLMDGTAPTAVLKRARGKQIVLSVKDRPRAAAIDAVAVRNHPTEPTGR